MSTNPYAVIGPGDETPPQYARVLASLSDREIAAELGKENDQGWRDALLAEQKRRASGNTADAQSTRLRSPRGASRPPAGSVGVPVARRRRSGTRRRRD